jgi:hypothetical protein
MKTRILFTLIFFSSLFSTCSKENHVIPEGENEPNGETPENLILDADETSLKVSLDYNRTLIDVYVNNGSYSGTTKVDYNDNQQIEYISGCSDFSDGESYIDVTYVEDQVSSIHYYNYFADTNETTDFIYNVVYEENKVSLIPNTDRPRLEYTFTNGYIDSYTRYLSAFNDHRSVFTFKRDQNNNIDTISVVSFTPTVNGELTREYYYSGHNSSVDVFDNYNPVYDWIIFSGSVSLLGEILNLKISNHPPAVGSFWSLSEGLNENAFSSVIKMATNERTAQVNSGYYLYKFRYK